MSLLVFKNKKHSNILLFLFFFNIFTITYIKAEENFDNSFTVITPSVIIEEIQKLEGNKNGEIPYRIGKFGEVPFGKTVSAMVFIQEQDDGSNYWCNFDYTSQPEEFKTYSSIYKEYIPMFLVDQGQCSYSKKAFNVQSRGGSAMLIVDDDNSLDNNDKYNVLDLRGNSIKIPSMIIPRNYGDVIKNYIREQKLSTRTQQQSSLDPVIVSIKFSAYNADGTIELNLFLSSDDLNAYSFYKYFDEYKNTLGDKLKFTPVYKYHNYKLYEANNDIRVKDDYPCFSKNDINFCGTINTDLGISNPRYVLLENLRQSCIFINYGVEIYWLYMIEFGNLCLKLDNPIFNDECAKMTLYHIKFQKNHILKIQDCMQDLIDFNSKVDDDYELFNYRKVYEYPLITLNGIKFKGMWLPRAIFNSICTSFIKNETICGSPQVKQLAKNLKLYSAIWVYVIGLLLFMFTFLLICCYRRFAYRSVEQALIEKIHTETIRAIGKRDKKKKDYQNK